MPSRHPSAPLASRSPGRGLAAACGDISDTGDGPADDGGGDASDDGADDGSDDGATGAPTYYGEVQPILQARCAGCHREGGIGTF